MNREPKDVQIPLVLIVLGLLLYGVSGFRVAGPQGTALVMGFVAITAVVGTIVMIAAAFITASLIGVSFGELGPASLKLAAIYIFPAAVAGLFPFGIVLAFFLWLGLLMWLFELEVLQAVVFTVVLISVNLLVGMALRGLFA